MYKQLIIICLLISSASLFSCQSNNENIEIEDGKECLAKVDGEFILLEIDESPIFKDGGYEGFSALLSEVVKYPAEAREKGIEGTCILNYEVNLYGETTNIELEEDPGGGIGQVVENGFKSVTEGESFIPAIYDGNIIEVRKSLILIFKLEG